MGKLLLTGVTGFIGGALLSRLALEARYTIKAALRRRMSGLPDQVERVYIGNIGPGTDWNGGLTDVDIVVHAAARAHMVGDNTVDALAEYKYVNVEGTLNLAQQAAKAGVERFIFISSIGVNGNYSQRPFTEKDAPKPVGPYAVAKLEAENGLMQLAQATEMEVVVIRPPLVYGPNAPGNFGRLMRAFARGIPLPLGSIHNKRSLVGLDNLIDLIVTCIDHPSAANQIFLVSDGEDLSTSDLIRRIAQAIGKPARLFPMPPTLLIAGATLLGKRDIARRLCGSLQVDISKARNLLDWAPPMSVDEELAEVARWYLEKDAMSYS